MVDMIKNSRFLVREFDEERDIVVVGKLEKECETVSNKDKGASMFTNMMNNPLCRVSFFSRHVMMVAELRDNGEIVGVVRGCIKHVATKFGGIDVKLGCILGLRVSPKHRRMGIGLELVRSLEEWLMSNGADYAFLATEKNNVASTNLFSDRCNYSNISSLVIFIQPISFPAKALSGDVKVEKLRVDQAISLYHNKLKGKDMYPTDMDAILKEKLSLGTWIAYCEADDWIGLSREGKCEDFVDSRPRSWVMFSVWNSCEAYKIHIRKSFFHSTLEKVLACFKLAAIREKPFGFLFLFGLHGEGERVGELMKAAWSFASRLAENLKDCKMIISELGVSDPLIDHVPYESAMSCINDLWYLKKVNDVENQDQLIRMSKGELGNVFIDPRDF